jgi:hypothetical protein
MTAHCLLPGLWYIRVVYLGVVVLDVLRGALVLDYLKCYIVRVQKFCGEVYMPLPPRK